MEALEECPMSCCVCDQWRLPSLLAMTHMRWSHSQSGRENGPHSVRGPPTSARTRTWAKMNVRPRLLCESEPAKRERKGKRNTDTHAISFVHQHVETNTNGEEGERGPHM